MHGNMNVKCSVAVSHQTQNNDATAAPLTLQFSDFDKLLVTARHISVGLDVLSTAAFLKHFKVGTTFISQNVLRTTLLLGLSNSLGLPETCFCNRKSLFCC